MVNKGKKVKTAQVNLRLAPEVKAAALKRAQEEHRTLTNYIEYLIERDIKRK